MTRIGTTGAALLTLALLATGCGGSSNKAGTSTKVPAATEAQAAAKAINLTKADVPTDWTSDAADDSDDEDTKIDKEMASCLGVDAATFSDTSDTITKVSSDDFSKGEPPSGVQLSSEVEVVKSTDKAKKQLALFTDNKTPDCLSKTFSSLLKDEIGADSPGVTVGTVDVKKVDVSKGDTDGAFGFDMKIPVQATGITLNVTFNIRGFLKKHTEVTLMSAVFGDAASADVDGLYSKLVDRAKSSAV